MLRRGGIVFSLTTLFSTGLALLRHGRKKIGYEAAWIRGCGAPGMPVERTGVTASCALGCLAWKRDERAEDDCVLPEVNVVLSVAQLSSLSRVYFYNCWRRGGKMEWGRQEEGQER